MTKDKDQDIERHNASYRLNPSGHKELVIKRKGKRDDETLNELMDSLDGLLGHVCEGCGVTTGSGYCKDCLAGYSGPLSDALNGLDESVAFAGPLPTGGGAGSSEQLEYQRNPNQPDAPLMVGSSGDQERNNVALGGGSSPSDLKSSEPQVADGPERSRAKSKHRATDKGNDIADKYITGYTGDGLDYGATHSESFTGTGAIAIAPGYTVSDEEDEEDEDNDTSESVMTRPTINEWQPTFKAAGYTPGDHQMPCPPGDGVAERKPTQDKVGQYDTDMSNQGQEWPRDHNDTPAMCDVDDDGVEHEPQGSHESSVGEPNDGHQTKLGHDWPDEASNSGSGVAEPFEGDRWSDGGTLKGGSAQDKEHFKAGGPGMPSDGPIKGTNGPQYGQPQESWSPDNIGTLMEDELDLQLLFDSYARQADYVCLEDFQVLCDAHGVSALLDEASMLTLMGQNKELMFHEGRDASGRYWVGVPLSERKKSGPCPKCKCNPCECKDEECMEESINEFQVRSPEDEARPYGGDPGMGGRRPGGDPDFGFDMYAGPDDAEEGFYDERLEASRAQEMGGPGPFGDACPECGTPDSGEESCPECGTSLGAMDDMDALEGPGTDFGELDTDIDFDDEMARQHVASSLPDEEEPMGPSGGMVRGSDIRRMARESVVVGPAMMESVKNFMTSAKSIIERNQGDFHRKSIGEALQLSWDYYANAVDPRRAPSRVRSSLHSLMRSYPPFNPINESGGGDAMESGGGSSVNERKTTSSDFLPDTESDTTDEGEAWPRKHSHEPEDTPVVKGTEKGMTGKGNYAQSVKENVSRLAKHVRSSLVEAARGIKGKYGSRFSVLVNENGQLNRTPYRNTLAEALADAEEVLQFHPANSVVLETYFHQKGNIIRKFDVPMVKVKKRGPHVSEGKALFRFRRTAEDFADRLVQEGKTCRINNHNWGHAVVAKVNYKTAERAFKSLHHV